MAEAYAKFCSNPIAYQEDFMFMGTGAFVYYFPVIDRYIREIEGPTNRFDCEAWILGHAMKHQFEPNVRMITPIAERAKDLCDFVLHGLSRLPEGSTFQPVGEIVAAWVEAKAAVMKAIDLPAGHGTEMPPAGADGGHSS